MRNKSYFIFPALILPVFLFSCHSQPKDQQKDERSDSVSAASPSSSPGEMRIIFPKAGEKLETGRSYTLKWTGGDSTVTIFLIDSSLESTGASVSISDRIYGIKNTGSYDYTPPKRLEPGTYKISIDTASSNYFKIVSP